MLKPSKYFFSKFYNLNINFGEIECAESEYDNKFQNPQNMQIRLKYS